MRDHSPWRETRHEVIANLAFGARDVVPLGSVSVIAGGVTLGRSLSGSGSVELPYLRVANVQDGFIDTSGMKTVRIFRTELERYRLRTGDVLMTEGGDFDKLGRGAVWDGSIDPCLHQNHIFRVRCDPSVLLPEYLAMYSASPIGRRLFLLLSKQTTNLASINLTQLKAFPVPIPSLREQRRIMELLDAANRAIRSTERLIASFDQAKQGLLRDLLTRGIDDSGKLRDPERDPAIFTSTQLGSRPINWRVLRVEELIQGRPKNGYSPKEVDQWTGILMLGLSCLTPNGFRPLQLKNAPLGDLDLQRAMLNDGNLLISRANTREFVGLAGRFKEVGTLCTYPDLMMRLVPNHRISSEYLEIVLRVPDTRRQIQAAASGTSGSMVKISSSVVCNLLVAIPDTAEQKRILAVLNAEASRSDIEERRLTKLRILKQGLMDDLLTGRVRVGATG